ncbi:dolichyl-diphosphooligosaccharide---protein glycosyltransferase [Nematocida sp. LUAm3]|nr:dolichyl-diphosphooligosaccharide---protein glycosyltransferase [Nematocida sp. LUAm3]KAI5175840.1 dolichyl-diphosphooligosaccharide---protein glycosyltransferase [Nematocida sp. LUAm2]KAI5178336.1 dolichyl-diphosphooligosaccharide---protein glycosyltransferase [Nematocida sp. LUAm1]
MEVYRKKKEERGALYIMGGALLGVGILLRLLPYFTYGSTINEFDPWFNCRCSVYMWENGIKKYFAWRDEKSWVPEGREIFSSSYPLLFLVSNGMHWIAKGLMNISHYSVCSFSSYLIFLLQLPIFASLFSEVLGEGAGRAEKVFGAGMFAISGGIFEKSICGAYDYESLSLFLLLLIIKAYLCLENKWIKKGIVCGGIQLAFRSAWGGSILGEGLICLFSLMDGGNLLFLVLFSAISTLGGILFPFLAKIDISLYGKIGCILLVCFLRGMKGKRLSKGIFWSFGLLPVYLGFFYVFSDKIYGFLNETKIYNLFFRQRKHPLVQSIAEHRMPEFLSIFWKFGPLFFLLPIFLCFFLMEKYNENTYKKKQKISVCLVFSILLYLRMERFSFLLSPFSSIVYSYALFKTLPNWNRKISNILKGMLFLGIFSLYVGFSLRSNYFEAQNIVIAFKGERGKESLILDDFREAGKYMKHNLPRDSIVISWWDYGYQITGMSGCSTVVDNNTNNYDKIAKVADFLLSPEDSISSHALIAPLKEKTRNIFIYTVTGYKTKYLLSDLNKVSWIAKIAHEYNKSVSPSLFFFLKDSFINKNLIDLQSLSAEEIFDNPKFGISPHLKNSLLFKCAFFQYSPKITLKSLNLFYQSQNHIVRIYQLI